MSSSGVPQFGAPPAPVAQLPGCDVANCIADLWFRLGFLNAADMARADRWVTLAELYQFADDAAKFLSRASAAFLTYDSSIGVTAGEPEYALPAGWVWTEGAWLLYAGLPLQQLRLSSVGQLFALDANWNTTTGNPLRLSLDAGPVGWCVLYPSPVAGAVLAEVLQVFPATVAAGASALPLSAVLQDYFTDAALAGARAKESDSAMPDVAAHCRERMALYEAVIGHLWGDGR